jgi:hypothetical protein
VFLIIAGSVCLYYGKGSSNARVGVSKNIKKKKKKLKEKKNQDNQLENKKTNSL